MQRHYRIAGLNVALDCSDRIVDQAEKYETDVFGKIEIEITREQVDRVIDLYLEKNQFENVLRSDLEYLASGALFSLKLLDFNGFRLHSSAIVVNDQAYLFSADSGTGKSTHTSLWLQQFGNCAYILNDDKPAVRFEDGVWYAYGTPWSGKHDISVNARVPIAGVAFLERSEQNSILRMNPDDAATALLMQINRNRFPEAMDKLLDLYDKFVQQVPIWNLKCNMDPEAAIVSYEAMSGEKFVPTTEK